MQAGDCVLQPPTIRHRVLEASQGLEVVEVCGPAEHPTWRDHELEMPTPELRPERNFCGQRFVRHVAAHAQWQHADDGRIAFRDTGIANATAGFASARVVRLEAGTKADPENMFDHRQADGIVFLYLLEGRLQLRCNDNDSHALVADDACAISAGTHCEIDVTESCEVLAVAMATPI